MKYLRDLKHGEKVRVYYNLHKHCWSIQEYKTRRVIAHCSKIDLINVVFKVSQTGRDKVLREQRKNVHAFVIGHVDLTNNVQCPIDSNVLYYNPYKVKNFVDIKGKEIYNCNRVVMENRKVWRIA